MYQILIGCAVGYIIKITDLNIILIPEFKMPVYLSENIFKGFNETLALDTQSLIYWNIIILYKRNV
jgi:hypothetical protein